MTILPKSQLTTFILLTLLTTSSSKKYLYSDPTDGEDAASSSFPIIEYMAPDNETLTDPQAMYDYMHPDFLYKPDGYEEYDPPPRVVEFYAPWCPHCKHFKPHFITLSQSIYNKQPKIHFHAISCVAHNSLCKSQNLNGFPTIKVFKQGSYIPQEYEEISNPNEEMMLEMLGFDKDGVQLSTGRVRSIRVRPPGKQNPTGNHVHKTSDNIEPQPKHIEIKPQPQIPRIIQYTSHSVSDVMHDAATSFEFALKYNIFMSDGALSSEQKDVFYKWLSLLEKTLPLEMERTRGIISLILENYDTATQSTQNIQTLLKPKYPPSKSPKWRTCTYETDNENGFTCGLWSLFHLLSVGTVEYNRHALQQSAQPIATRFVSDVIRDYIAHFFQCDVCRVNFLKVYDECGLDACNRLSSVPSHDEGDWKQLPLWLWETHNHVNVRLQKERLDRDGQEGPSEAEVREVRWPSVGQCRDCWREDFWDEDEVYQFLYGWYWTGNSLETMVENKDKEASGSTENKPLSMDSSLEHKNKFSGHLSRLRLRTNRLLEGKESSDHVSLNRLVIAFGLFAILLLVVWAVKSRRLVIFKGVKRDKTF